MGLRKKLRILSNISAHWYIKYWLFKITEQSFVVDCAYEQFSLIGSCYTGGCDHTTIIYVLLAHQRSLWMNVLYLDDLEGEGIQYSGISRLQWEHTALFNPTKWEEEKQSLTSEPGGSSGSYFRNLKPLGWQPSHKSPVLWSTSMLSHREPTPTD